MYINIPSEYNIASMAKRVHIGFYAKYKKNVMKCICAAYLDSRKKHFELPHDKFVFCLCWGLMSQSAIFQSCRDGATASWVLNQYFRGVKCLAQGHNTAEVGFEPQTSCSGVRHSTTEPPRSPSHDKTNTMTFVPSEDSDQPGHLPCLIRAFTLRSEGSLGPNFA